MKKSTVLLMLSIPLALLFASSAAMATYAAWSVQSDTVNAVSMGSVQVKLEEEYEQGQELMPGMTADKKVWARNTGLLDAAVRAKITKLWGTQKPNGDFNEDKTLSTDNIVIPTNQTDWYYNKEDDYYYYKGVLAPGAVTPPLFERFTLRAEDGNEYRNKHAQIIVEVECVQAQGDGISAWNMTFETLGVSYKAAAPVNTVGRVQFVSPEAGFTFPDNGGDLFAAFKLLAPGEHRSQAVEVKNLWGKPAEIFLWATEAEQVRTRPEDLALVNQLLREYAQITITEGTAQIYTGAVWGNPALDSRAGDSMRHPYSLGVFQPGQSKTLRVDLTLDKRMDNQFRDLIGLVNWVFSASGDEGTAPSSVPATTGAPGSASASATGTVVPAPPTTGDEHHLLLWACLAAGSGVLLVFTMLAARRQKREERTG